jgi:tetratricopeptide (TPR) repeat protein
VEADEALSRGDPSGALGLYQRAKEIVDRAGCADNVGPVLYGIGRCNFALNRFEKALEAYLHGKQLIEGNRAISNPQSGYIIYILSDLGTLYMNMGDYAEAKKAAVECLSLIESRKQERWLPEYTTRYGLAQSWATLGNVAAWEEVRKALWFIWKSHSVFLAR